jgi:hypothetical protein
MRGVSRAEEKGRINLYPYHPLRGENGAELIGN